MVTLLTASAMRRSIQRMNQIDGAHLELGTGKRVFGWGRFLVEGGSQREGGKCSWGSKRCRLFSAWMTSPIKRTRCLRISLRELDCPG